MRSSQRRNLTNFKSFTSAGWGTHDPRSPDKVVLAIPGFRDEDGSFRIVGRRIAVKGHFGAAVFLRAMTKSAVDVTQSESGVVRVERRRSWRKMQARLSAIITTA